MLKDMIQELALWPSGNGVLQATIPNVLTLPQVLAHIPLDYPRELANTGARPSPTKHQGFQRHFRFS